ncbi:MULTISPECIES: tryptophan synthase subunit alpha [Methanobacterium]|jgi:tryptophan synthase alpha chain|uniref:Tryptophan synthase alpha chain n=1 Tax=Methanobacterium subterraneum TaxID=59277 RepID=A0A7K4DQ15_9EURY|nr:MULTISPECIES: tryptophan synthase subunit alpha [Methanobacterium]AUB58089.1 tryptophan synthase subunit alpha [Methanobacterium sp. MZ-A1]MBW4256728.1 tryptophan synthase subunit alpha [Methanobacterium sp. YSL]NMO10116.1 tryptophan synthase subunit alpha [Methanobacterium subterraneum]
MSSQDLKVESYQEMFARVKEKNEGAFIPFIVAGDPDFETSLEIVKTFVENGADALEIGFAFSDPVADGPTVQDADLRALNSGMTTKRGFEFIKRIREFTTIPIGLLVYYNLIYQIGIDHFYEAALESGVNAVLAADLPPEESQDAVAASRKYGVQQVFMAAQTTTNERLQKISGLCEGFLYVVAVMGVTGARGDLQISTVELIERVRSHTDLPLSVGFGISKPEHVSNVIKAGADGAIVASAILNMITENLEDKDAMKEKIGKFCRELKEATKK